MEYVPGGDFRTLLNNAGVLKEEHARFYFSEMFMSVTELHRLGYIHRDLKPEVGSYYRRNYYFLTLNLGLELSYRWSRTCQAH
jgi:tRNA A-37 threonylcarbamoyl transferase component Bud32